MPDAMGIVMAESQCSPAIGNRVIFEAYYPVASLEMQTDVVPARNPRRLC
jgi:hypothetical protein